jgi:hypothetical protein
MKTLLSPPSFDDLLRLLRAWRFWVFGAVLGGMLGVGVYFVAPPEYRARATVVVSFNMEKSWPVNSDKELFYYLEREARKVEEVTRADATLQQVADETGFSVLQLRSGKLELSQPKDGAWHFYATDPQAAVAVQLASAWAGAFSAQIRQGIETAVALDATRKALIANPTDEKLLSTVTQLEAKSLGITPELQISFSQARDFPAERKSGLGVYVLAGSVFLLAVGALLILFVPRMDHATRNN